ncbi:PREDICTED: homeobox-leucine zipper protein HAT22-like [Ipomoea nil]|uniref:homeobox-leucine zipper protein HAT22-like n=1 Tax=Ipomoea nil TaxID=35883 RepID=UPI000900F19D|nr:PREDICTED: homeobox-leucine zipper protein HAT22-like [Ipomoea nil]
MGFEDDSICNTALTLSLLGSSDHDVVAAPGSGCRFHLKSSPPVSDTTCLRPSLTLGGPPPPEEELKFEVAAEEDGTSMASSFSNSSMKREREIGGGGEEEVELEIMEPTKGLSGDDDEVVGTRKKLRLTKEQSVVLEDSFKEHSTLNSKQKEHLARKLNLRPRQVEVWFQNRRARNKLKQTEVDCELLRKCYDSLTDENRRLQRELQELKAKTPAAAAAVAVAQPFYMQLSAATPLTMCPSCQRTYGGSGDNSAANIGEKSHYYGSKHNGTIAC